MKYYVKLGKIDYEGCGLANNEVIITVEVKDTEKGKVLSMCGEIWDRRHFDCVSGGQNLDEILEFFPNSTRVKKLHAIWKRWHLNDLHAGCVHQRPFELEPYENHAKEHCSICNYVYGTAWKFEPIPESVIRELSLYCR